MPAGHPASAKGGGDGAAPSRAWLTEGLSLAKIYRRLARVDHSFERELRTWLAPDLLILDDFGLRELTAQESSDVYDVLVERDRRAATVITSNRAVDEWVALLDDPILASSALDRFAHRAQRGSVAHCPVQPLTRPTLSWDGAIVKVHDRRLSPPSLVS